MLAAHVKRSLRPMLRILAGVCRFLSLARVYG
nr:MAG TPA: hypothetical protein [Caudoviricetes sp.]